MPARTAEPLEVEAPFDAALVEIGRAHPEVVVLSADLSKYTDILGFASEFPDRFLQVGMAEQNMMGIAGGIAKSGLTPVAVTYGVFATRRACEQIQMALATGTGTTAVVVAFLPGISTPFRATHQATDDLAIMRGVPGMTVVDPADGTDLIGAITAAVSHPGPVYLRGLRGRVRQVLDPEQYNFALGAAHLLRDGADIGLLGSGLGTQWAMDAADNLRDGGISAAVLHVPTLKPLDEAAIAAFTDRFARVLTVENHSVIGGLGSAVAEVMADRGSGTRLTRLGVPDSWSCAGPLDYIRERLGLDSAAIAAVARGLAIEAKESA